MMLKIKMSGKMFEHRLCGRNYTANHSLFKPDGGKSIIMNT